MKVRYRVVLKENNTAKDDQKKDGYLASFGRIGSYTRGEAIKKADMFGGEIERVEETFIITDAKMAQIHENNLLKGVLKELKGREQFEDTEDTLGERIYNADVFEQILSEIGEDGGNPFRVKDKKVIDQLEELADALGEYQYVQITVI